MATALPSTLVLTPTQVLEKRQANRLQALARVIEHINARLVHTGRPVKLEIMANGNVITQRYVGRVQLDYAATVADVSKALTEAGHRFEVTTERRRLFWKKRFLLIHS